MITIYLSNTRLQIEDNSSLSALLKQAGYTDKGYAVAINNQFITAANHARTLLEENDVIDIIVPMQGG